MTTGLTLSDYSRSILRAASLVYCRPLPLLEGARRLSEAYLSWAVASNLALSIVYMSSLRTSPRHRSGLFSKRTTINPLTKFRIIVLSGTVVTNGPWCSIPHFPRISPLRPFIGWKSQCWTWSKRIIVRGEDVKVECASIDYGVWYCIC